MLYGYVHSLPMSWRYMPRLCSKPVSRVQFIRFFVAGYSGLGKYHGKYGFDTFSNQRGTLLRCIGMEKFNTIRYPPYNDSKLQLLTAALEYRRKGMCTILWASSVTYALWHQEMLVAGVKEDCSSTAGPEILPHLLKTPLPKVLPSEKALPCCLVCSPHPLIPFHLGR